MRFRRIRNRLTAFGLATLTVLASVPSQYISVYAGWGENSTEISDTSINPKDYLYTNFNNPQEMYKAFTSAKIDHSKIMNYEGTLFWTSKHGKAAPTIYYTRYQTIGYTVRIEQIDMSNNKNPTGNEIIFDLASSEIDNGENLPGDWGAYEGTDKCIYKVNIIPFESIKKYAQNKNSKMYHTIFETAVGNTGVASYQIQLYPILTVVPGGCSASVTLVQQTNGSVTLSSDSTGTMSGDVYKLIEESRLNAFLKRAQWGDPKMFKEWHEKGFDMVGGSIVVRMMDVSQRLVRKDGTTHLVGTTTLTSNGEEFTLSKIKEDGLKRNCFTDNFTDNFL